MKLRIACIAALAAATVVGSATAGDRITYNLNDSRVGKARNELISQQRHSADVIRFFTQGHRWMTAPRHRTCRTVAWSRTCAVARRELRHHRWLHRIATKRLGPPEINDWTTAVAYVQRWFPGTYGWLIACSSSEGGHGEFVWGGSGDDYGGWMQYHPNTFSGDYAVARAYVREHFGIELGGGSIYSPFDQAVAAGHAKAHGRAPSGKWTGARC